MEHKIFPSFVTKVDEAQGIVEHLVAVMGNKDLGDDVIWPGAFTKTLNERGNKVKVLDLHKTDSIMRVLGKPLMLHEIGAAELPETVKAKYPDATGALAATTQFNLKTPEGLGAFERVKAGDISEWSFGYDAINPDFSKGPDGKTTVRNLREVRLFEYSPVIFGMNEATMTLSAKTGESMKYEVGSREATGANTKVGDVPSEGKPWQVFHQGDKWRVYKLDEAGDPTGDPLGEFDTEAEARTQQRALYASEADAAGKAANGAAGLPLAPRGRAWDSTAAEGRVRTWAEATDAPNAKYRSAFFWYDSSAPENFTSYKLQFADVIGGELQAIPRGIFAVAGVLSGARGGADIPAADAKAIQAKVAAYYAKMRQEFEDDAIIPPWEKSEKALTFQAALGQDQQEQALNDQRWKFERALSDSMVSIVEDPNLDAAAKVGVYRQSLIQYSEAMVGWFGQSLAANYWNEGQGLKKSAKAGRRLKGDMVTMLDQMAELLNEMRDWANYQDVPPSSEDTAPAETQAAKTAEAQTQQAGPPSAPTSNDTMLKLIEIEQELLHMEV